MTREELSELIYQVFCCEIMNVPFDVIEMECFSLNDDTAEMAKRCAKRCINLIIVAKEHNEISREHWFAVLDDINQMI